MKINQFAQIKVTPKQRDAELQRIGLFSPTAKQQTVSANFAHFLRQCFPEAHTTTTKQEAIANLMLTTDQSVPAYLAEPSPLTLTQFYNVGLQLLGYEVGSDFSLAEPLSFIRQNQLAFSDTPLTNNDALFTAIYLLLTTHTKMGVTYLDDLANRGFFNAYQGKRPLFFNGKAQAVFDTQHLIKEVVYVESDLDTDQDGQRDLLAATIFRPAVAEPQLKIPALYTASPYYKGTNNVDKYMHNVDQELAAKTPGKESYPKTQAKPLPAARTPQKQATTSEKTATDHSNYSLNDYFLARGFANVYAGGIGTRDSDGIRTCGSAAETSSTTAIIEWLAGNRRAFTNRTDRIEIKADWCNGNVAMTGKSYLGTLATAAATTGVAGLKTIIAEAAISSWYDYYRDNGLVVAPVDCQGEDADVLAALCQSRQKDAADKQKVEKVFSQELAKLKAGQDRTSGNYNAFWDARNYRKNAANTKADVVLVHGLNDWNVKPRNAEKMWQALKQTKVNRKLILHQGKHIYINNMPSLDFTDMMNLWLSYQLYDVANNAPKVLPNVTIQDNRQPETWHAYHDWAPNDRKRQLFYFTPSTLQTKEPTDAAFVPFKDDSTAVFKQQGKDEHRWLNDFILGKAAYQPSQAQFKTQPLTQPLLIDGNIDITLQAAVDQTTGLLSVMVIDYGHDQRLGADPTVVARDGYQLDPAGLTQDLVEFQLAAATDYQLITRGHINLQNRNGADQVVPVNPHEFYTVHFALQPTHFTVPAGHQLGVIVYASDMGMTVRPETVAHYQLDLNACQLSVPYMKK
ncbi:Xaa-Pro dipeptidyl-peptidase [Loigolactobacillus rennini]|uniref:Xaa-Pro dipeptidyl-peptidase n=1 Tax=Loigolactobacillus rennini DSM 20253 TaxID=1423796 RepID=A0A0R2D729_9LACO|nr:Xaa-Pro dipeptidyl-peptidase [Loigolactobacillus rennini]KRM99552.1 x-prolyl-dipeptidyl aminopeptidase [Loigolactobacillus rennini DSM 20253]